MKLKRKLFKGMKISAAFVLILTAVVCVGKRLPEVYGGSDAVIAAAAFTLTDGKYMTQSGTEPTSVAATAPTASGAVQTNAKTDIPKSRDKSGYYNSHGDHSGEAVYDVTEKTIGADGTAVGEGWLKNRAGLDVDFNAALNKPLTFQIQKNAKSPQVLIYHTHTGEAYLDEDVDYFYESYYSRTNNNDFNVVAVGNAITEALNQHGVNTLHDITVHDSTYNGSYDRSAQTVTDNLKKNPGIKVVLDIHRDALGTEQNKVKTTFEYNGKKGAQIMILSGCDPDNERGFVNWKNNLSFALKLQNTAEKLYPGMTRPVSFDYFAYNEYICDGSLLIEIGTDANSIDEAEYSGRLLANVLAKVLLN